jgi:hypothetical protein
MEAPEAPGRKPLQTRRQLAGHLREKGYPIGNSTLDKLCSPLINEGPPIAAWWGRRPLYDPDVGVEWAEARLRPATSANAFPLRHPGARAAIACDQHPLGQQCSSEADPPQAEGVRHPGSVTIDAKRTLVPGEQNENVKFERKELRRPIARAGPEGAAYDERYPMFMHVQHEVQEDITMKRDTSKKQKSNNPTVKGGIK